MGIERNLFVLPRERRVEQDDDGNIHETDVVPKPEDVDELGEIAVTDKTDFALSSGGQLCCLTELFLLCFAFIFFFF